MHENLQNKNNRNLSPKARRGLMGFIGVKLGNAGEKRVDRQLEHHIDPVVTQVQVERGIIPEAKERKKPKRPISASAIEELVERFNAMRHSSKGGTTTLDPSEELHLRAGSKHHIYNSAYRMGAVAPLHERYVVEETRALIDADVLGGLEGIDERWTRLVRPAKILELRQKILDEDARRGIPQSKTLRSMSGRGAMGGDPEVLAQHFDISRDDWQSQRYGHNVGVAEHSMIPTEVLDRMNLLMQLPVSEYDETGRMTHLGALDRLAQLDANF